MSSTWIESTVGQLVVERPSRARIFEKLGIDYCCGGKKPLFQAISEKGLDLQRVVAELEQEVVGQQSEPHGRDWSTASLTDLCDHIETTYHRPLKEELPRIEFLTHKVAARHGDGHPELIEIHRIFVALQEELTSHMMKEERVLFPICRQLDKAEKLPPTHCGSIANPIGQMVHEHDDAGLSLARINELTNNYTPPADACNTYRATFDALRQLERDMHQHVHKENHILFRKAERLEKLLSRNP